MTKSALGHFLSLIVLFAPSGLSAVACQIPSCSGSWNIVGNGSVVGIGHIRLTSDTMNQNTAMWLDYQLDLNQDWSREFDLFFGTKDATGADGLVFVMHNDARGFTAIGDTGQGLAYGNVDGTPPGISPSLAVEFDTWHNDGGGDPLDFNDPSYDHVSIHLNGNGDEAFAPVPYAQASAASANIEDGAWHRVRFDWNRASNIFQVYFDGILRLTYSNDIVASVFSGTSCVYWGFTAGTGGSSNLQEVKDLACLTATPTFSVSPTLSPTPTPYPPGCGPPIFQDARLIGSGCIGGGPNFTFPYTAPAAANQLLLIRIENTANAALPTSVAFGGVAMTLQSTGTTGYSNTRLHTYYLANPPTGPQNLTFSHSGNCNWNIAAELYRNVDTAAPVGPTNSTPSGQGDASTGFFSLSVATTGYASLVSVYMASEQVCNAGDVPVLGTGQVSHNLRTTGVSMACCECVFGDYKDVGGPGTYLLTYDLAQANRRYYAQPIEIMGAVCASPTPAGSPTASPTPSPSPSATQTRTQSPTPSASPSPAGSLTASPSPTVTPSRTPSHSPSPSFSMSPTRTETAVPPPTATPLPTNTFTPEPLELHLYPNSPNPFDPAKGTWFAYNLNVDSTVEITVFDVSGERVRELKPFAGRRGSNEQYWDGQNSAGTPVASGVFIYRVIADRGLETKMDFSKCAALR